MSALHTDWLTAHGGAFRAAARLHRHSPRDAATLLAVQLRGDPAARADAIAERTRCAGVIAARGSDACVVTNERHALLNAALAQIGDKIA